MPVAHQKLTECRLATSVLREMYQRRLRTRSSLNRRSREVKRRKLVAIPSPQTNSHLPHAASVFIEISEDWEAGGTCLRMHIE